MKRISVLLGGLCLSLAAVVPASASTVYTQTTTPSSLIPGSASETGTNAGNSSYTQAYDDFTLAATAAFSQISWRGLETNGASTVNSFTITIYSNDFTLGSPGSVGTVLYTFTVQGADTNQTFVGTLLNGQSVFDFSAALPAAFTATAGTTYWVSILADITGGDYSWASSNGGNDSFLSRNSSDLSSIGLDGTGIGLAFTLSTPGVTPEPSALMLTGTGLLGGFGMLRRRITQR